VTSSKVGTITTRWSSVDVSSGGTGQNGDYSTPAVAVQQCALGEIALSGGADFTDASGSQLVGPNHGELHLMMTYPLGPSPSGLTGSSAADPTGWVAVGANDTGDAAKLRVYALCLAP
jgi:hypothetical protein